MYCINRVKESNRIGKLTICGFASWGKSHNLSGKIGRADGLAWPTAFSARLDYSNIGPEKIGPKKPNPYGSFDPLGRGPKKPENSG